MTTPRTTETPASIEEIASSASDLLRGAVPLALRYNASPADLVSMLAEHASPYASAHADALRHAQGI